MALKIRLRQQGRTNRVFYRLVVADARSPRDGKYVEALGWYNPVEASEENKWTFKTDRIQHWLNMGAELTENVQNLIKQAAPEIIQGQIEKVKAHRAKLCAKRKARRAASKKSA